MKIYLNFLIVLVLAPQTLLASGVVKASDLDKVEAAGIVDTIWSAPQSLCASETLLSPVSLNSIESPCASSKSGTSGSLVSVSSESAKSQKMVKVSFKNSSEIPPALKEFIPGEILERSKDGRWDLSVSFPNDNPGFGVWQLVAESDGGNDFGYTHGTEVKIGTDTNGYYQQISAGTNLYTQQASEFYKDKNGRKKVDQFFAEENFVKFVIDNKNKGRAVFYEAGMALVEINKDNVHGWLYATGEQELFHKYTAEYDTKNIATKGQNQTGVSGQAAIGHISDAIIHNGAFRLSGEINARVIKSSIKDADSATATAQLNAYHQTTEKSWAYKGSVEISSMAHQTSNSPSTSVGAGVSAGKGGFSAALTAKKTIFGDPQNYVGFNQDKNIVYAIELVQKLGQPKSKYVKTGGATAGSDAGSGSGAKSTNFKAESLAANQEQYYQDAVVQNAAIVFGQWSSKSLSQ